jgi:ferredoxin
LKLQIEDYCIRCGICITLYPELYEMNYAEDVVCIKLGEIPEDLSGKAKQSIRDCAVTAIRLRK